MKAILIEQFGNPEVLKIKETVKPKPKENELLVKVVATSVNYGDLIARKFKYLKRKEFNMPGLFFLMAKLAFGLNKPRINVLGSEFSGVVESVGSKVKKYKAGNEVFGFVGQSMGAYAEYLTIKDNDALAIKPTKLSFEEAAVSTYGALMALPLIRKSSVQPGQKVLINGASGEIGSAALQMAKALCAKVTGVCSTQNTAYVKRLGADFVIDYKKEDFTQNGVRYDLIFDVLGKLSYSKCKNSLTPTGKILYVSFKTGKLLQSLFNQKIICTLAPGNVADMLEVKKLIENGTLNIVLDKTFPMEQADEAHRYMEEKRANGKVSIKILTI